jgi:hypothetical protein
MDAQQLAAAMKAGVKKTALEEMLPGRYPFPSLWARRSWAARWRSTNFTARIDIS